MFSSPKSQSHNQKTYRIILKNLLLYLLSKTDQKRHRKRTLAPKSTAKSLRNKVFCWLHEKRSSVILVMAIVSLTGVMGHQLYNQPQMKVGTIAPQTFIAPYSASIEDQKQTEAKRKTVTTNSVPVLMIDAKKNEQIKKHLQRVIDEGNEIRAVAGSFPFFDISVLPIPTQRYLRSCLESEWQQLLVTLENTQKPYLKFSKPKLGQAAKKIPSKSSTPTVQQGNNQIFPASPSHLLEFNQALLEIDAYRLTTSEKDSSSLITQISESRKKYFQANAKLLQIENESSERVYVETSLLELSDQNWAETQKGIHQSAERILTQGLPSGLPRRILEDAVSLQVQVSVPGEAESLATKVLLTVLKPNLTQDKEQTKQQAQQAVEKVSSVMVDVRRGEVIVKKGERITEWKFDVLEEYHLIRRQVNWLNLIGLAGLVSVAIGIFVWLERRIDSQLRERDRLLILLLAISVPSVIAMGVQYTTWSAIGLLLGSFYGSILAVTVVGLLSLILPITIEISKMGLLAGAAGGILSSCVAQRLRSREELALLGIFTALTQGGIYLLLNIIVGAAFRSSWYLVLQESAFFALSGLAWSIIALGLSPYLEKLFDLTTPIRLAELANPNRPLLKRLATETPGTFQHTLFVATLAEAAAKQLRCNVELVRAGTLYHDIGKMHDPLGFIENQMGGSNKHDTEIKDPWKSAAIIKKHVTEGLVMAKKHSLPTAIQAFIPEHQGTMAIAYFYHQAQQMAKEDPTITVDKADFSYDGPIPQSRETGIVMLADSCEAALRSLKDATPEQALSMLNNILRAKWQDEQLIDSGLTRDEMSKIAQIFVDVWQQFHHKRIAYPKLKAGS